MEMNRTETQAVFNVLDFMSRILSDDHPACGLSEIANEVYVTLIREGYVQTDPFYDNKVPHLYGECNPGENRVDYLCQVCQASFTAGEIGG